LDGHPAGSIVSISAPVFDSDGALALMVNIHNIPVTIPGHEVQRCLERLLEATARITERLA
jgi:DNA-binding IclR family transcriptional regulator